MTVISLLWGFLCLARQSLYWSDTLVIFSGFTVLVNLFEKLDFVWVLIYITVYESLVLSVKKNGFEILLL